MVKIGAVISSVVGGVASAVGAANILSALGFGAAGVKAASLAAGWQAGTFGAAVPAGSWFAIATSLGATGVMTGPLVIVAAPVGAAVAHTAYHFLTK